MVKCCSYSPWKPPPSSVLVLWWIRLRNLQKSTPKGILTNTTSINRRVESSDFWLLFFGEFIKVCKICYQIAQQFSTSVPQKSWKHTIPNYFVRGTDLFSLRLSNKKMTTVNTRAVQCEWSKIIPILLVRSAKAIIFFGVLQNFSNLFLCAMRWKKLKVIEMA